METIKFSIITILFLCLLVSSQSALGLIYSKDNSTLEKDVYGNPIYQTDYNDSKLIVSNLLNGTIFKEGETITVIPEVTNLGNKTVHIGYDPPMFSFIVKDQLGKIVYWSGTPGLLVSFGMTLKPNMSYPAYVPAGMAIQKETFSLTSGNYTITSIARFTSSSYPRSDFFLWSEPTSITVLAEKIPEFPSLLPIFLISVSLIILISSRLKIKF